MAADRGRLRPDQVELGRARAAVARARNDDAVALLAKLISSSDPMVEMRAKIQLALVRQRCGRRKEAGALLAEVATLVGERRAARQERSEFDNAVTAGAMATELRPEARAHLDLQLELARTWSRIGRRKEAKTSYLALLREAELRDAQGPAARHVAVAEYRLAELIVGESPADACEHWRRAMDTGDDQISPHAALRMASQVGSPYLLAERVENLFEYARASIDRQVRREATLGLARHLEQNRQFDEARGYFKEIADPNSDEPVAKTAIKALQALRSNEDAAGIRAQLSLLPGLNAKVKEEVTKAGSSGRRVIVVGAGTGGRYLLESLDRKRYAIYGFIDDHATEIPGHRILGRIEDLEDLLASHRPDEVLLAIPTLAGDKRKEVVKACEATSTRLVNLPRMHELGIGWTRREGRRRLVTQLRPVEIEQTIGAGRVELDALATGWLRQKTVLVVGAGALGAEICRRLADGDVGRLVVIDRRQSALSKIESDLADVREFRALVPRAGDATEPGYLAGAFDACLPTVVFNTTGGISGGALEPSRSIRDPQGWKTVVRNEILTAKEVARAAADTSVPRVVHISSRCAGSPRSPFGAVKALAEELVFWHASRQPGCVQSVARVGQLLDSRNGSFARMKRQIQVGATVTVPGPNASARFISTARWAELVLHCARLASSGEVFEPSGGEEIAPHAVAEEAIRLYGASPGEDILIEEAPRERWDIPLSAGPRLDRGESGLGVEVLPRLAASDESLLKAIATCSTLIGEFANDPNGAVESTVGDFIYEFANVWLARA